ncbi:hypothetical protein [Ruania alba]|uniref:hypothetical protein n=1 Tax=Ruania alba TaxID=648782 RepID=UPI0011138BF4|nr:hypothetical protein [Ruania alba]
MALVGLLTLTGCNPPSENGSDTPVDGSPSTSSAPDEGASDELVESALYPGAWATPIEQALTPDQDRFEAVSESSALAVEQCMIERGFTRFVAKREARPIQRYYGVIDPDVARVWGYTAPSTAGEETDDPNAAPPMENAPLAEEDIALAGTDESRTEEVTLPDGTVVARYDPEACWNIGRLQVQPHLFEMVALQMQLENMLNNASMTVENSAEFREAYDEWAACVVDKGETNPPFPDGLYGTVSSSSGEVSAEEISEAVAHAECKGETGFLREWSQLRVEAEQELIAQTPGPLAEYVALAEETYSGGS